MRCWCGYVTGVRCRLQMVQLMPVHPKTPSSLASFKSRLVLPFWYRLTQAVLEKRPLNGCSISCSSSSSNAVVNYFCRLRSGEWWQHFGYYRCLLFLNLAFFILWFSLSWFLSTQQVCMEPYASAVDMMLPAAAAEARAAISWWCIVPAAVVDICCPHQGCAKHQILVDFTDRWTDDWHPTITAYCAGTMGSVSNIVNQVLWQ